MSDRLEDALRAMREGTTGESPRARETLDRVVAAKLEERRVWRRRARMWLPIAAVLAFSTAALARWGSLDGVRARLFSTDDAPAQEATPRAAHPPPPAGTASSPVANEAPEPPMAPEPAPVAPPASPERVAPPPVAEEPAPPVRPRLTAPGRAERPHPAESLTPKQVPDPSDVQAASSPSAAAPSASAPAAPESPEASAYAGAHRLHFAGRDPAAALAAWDAYLARFPDGTFAPDARYNRAIDLLKLRRYAEARAALQPFADGAFGGYHRDDARELLRSLRSAP